MTDYDEHANLIKSFLSKIFIKYPSVEIFWNYDINKDEYYLCVYPTYKAVKTRKMIILNLNDCLGLDTLDGDYFMSTEDLKTVIGYFRIKGLIE